MKPPPLRLPEVFEHRASSGMRMLASSRGPLPLVAVRLLVQAGSAVDPPGKQGLSSFTAQLYRRGTTSMTADAINEAVEFVGAHLSVASAEDFMVFRLTTPSEHLPAMLEVLAELVSSPSFPEDEVASAKDRSLAELSTDLDDPALVADRALVRALYGEHPYGHDVSGRASHVETFSREDVAGFHRRFIGPKTAWLSAVGDVDPDDFFERAERAFGAFSGGLQSPPEIPALSRAAAEGRVIVVDKPDQTQTQVRLGGLAFAKNHPDFMSAYVANTLLGGSFTSRLMNEIRVNRGLSYGVSSMLDLMKATGTFGISTFTKTQSTGEVVTIALEETAKMRARRVSAKELEQTQRYLSGLYPLRTETNEAIAASITDIRLYGLSHDWIERFRERIFEVTRAQVHEAASRYFFASPPTVVLLGKASEIEPQSKKWGELERWKVGELR
jgi:zinc protease